VKVVDANYPLVLGERGTVIELDSDESSPFYCTIRFDRKNLGTGSFPKEGIEPVGEDTHLQDVGNLPEPIHSTPVDLTKHWNVLAQTKAEFKASGRTGIVLLEDPTPEYRAKLAAFLARFNHKWEMKKPYLVIEHETEAKALFDLAIKSGLRAELIVPTAPEG
jgi:hypothetical protein